MNACVVKAGWFSVAVVALSLMAGCRSEPLPRGEHRLARAIPLNYATECVPADDRERKLFDLAASVIETTRGDELSSLDIGAQKFLGNGYHRGPSGKSVAVCAPDGILLRVADALAARGGLGRGSLVEYQLKLAGMLPRLDPVVIDQVGNAAFGKIFMWSEFFPSEDIRPRIRTVLAGFGTRASKFSQLAYEQMSGEDSLGTGAAQVAAATGHPEALPRIVTIMEQMLARTSEDEAIAFNTQERLYELSLALYFAGPAAKPYTGPIHKILRRKVQSWAPPFGMIEVPPTEHCGLLASIEGAAAVKPFGVCAGKERTPVLLPRS